MPTRPKSSAEREKLPIRHIEVKNFLSLRHIEVTLGSLNVLVGPNGAGKSNFLSIFRFLGEVARTDLAPALQTLYGGYERAKYLGKNGNERGIEINLSGEISEHSSPIALDEYKLHFSPLLRNKSGILLHREEVLLLKRSAGRGRRITLKGNRYGIETLGARKRTEAIVRSDKEGGAIEADASALSVLRRIGHRTDTNQVNELAEVFENLRLFDPVVDMARLPTARTQNLHLSSDAANLTNPLI